MSKAIFLNFPVKDLPLALKFYESLGFVINPEFSDENAACIVIDKGFINAMIMTEPRFKSFIKKEISDAKKSTEALFALQVNSKEEVDQIYNKAIAAGGSEGHDPFDYGWMYGKSFDDLDGHTWEVLYMDEEARRKAADGQA